MKVLVPIIRSSFMEGTIWPWPRARQARKARLRGTHCQYTPCFVFNFHFNFDHLSTSYAIYCKLQNGLSPRANQKNRYFYISETVTPIVEKNSRIFMTTAQRFSRHSERFLKPYLGSRWHYPFSPQSRSFPRISQRQRTPY